MALDDKETLQALLLGGIATTALTNLMLHRHLTNTLESTPNVKDDKISEIYKAIGIDPSFPTFKTKGLENAFYASPLVSKMIMPQGISKELKAKIKEVGHIQYDPSFNKASIIAHEAGHAAIRTTKPWWNASRVNQSVLRPLSGFAGLLNSSAAAITGLSTHSPLMGALAGLAAASVTGAPKFINELQATGYAKKYLNESSLKQITKDKNKSALNKAFGTYLIGSLMYPTLAGALAGGLAEYKDNAKQ